MPQASERLLATPKIKPRLPCIRPLAMGFPPRSGAAGPLSHATLYAASGWNNRGTPRGLIDEVSQGTRRHCSGCPMSAVRRGLESLIPALRRFARALARDAETADDLVQDTLVRAPRGEHLFPRGGPGRWALT